MRLTDRTQNNNRAIEQCIPPKSPLGVLFLVRVELMLRLTVSDAVWSNALIALDILLSYSVSMFFKGAENVF